MLKENLIAERIACEHYRELIRYFGDKDPTTRVMMERILINEEEHANDMHGLLVAHEGKPMLPSIPKNPDCFKASSVSPFQSQRK